MLGSKKINGGAMQVKTKYIADDGTSFDTEQECLQYEETMRKRAEHTHHFLVIHDADLTEGRGYFSQSMFSFVCYTSLFEAHMRDFCYKRYGPSVQYVQGVSEIPAWILSKIDKDRFDTAQHFQSPGMNKKETRRYKLKFNDEKRLDVDLEIKWG